MIVHNACMICRHKNDGQQELNILRQIEQRLSSQKDDSANTNRHRLPWYDNIKCQYGMPCDKLQHTKNELSMIQSSIEKKIDILDKIPKGEARAIIEMFRGYYPRVYSNLIRTIKN